MIPPLEKFQAQEVRLKIAEWFACKGWILIDQRWIRLRCWRRVVFFSVILSPLKIRGFEWCSICECSISSWFADGMLQTVHRLAMKWCDSFPASSRMLATWWSCKRGICRWGSGKGERENERKTMITKTYDYPPGNRHIPLLKAFLSRWFSELPGDMWSFRGGYAFGIEAMVLDGHGKKGHVVSGALKALICLAGYTPTVRPFTGFCYACCVWQRLGFPWAVHSISMA